MINLEWSEDGLESNIIAFRFFKHIGMEFHLIVDDTDIIGGVYCSGKHFFQSLFAVFQYLDPGYPGFSELGYVPDNLVRLDAGARFMLDKKSGDSTRLVISYNRVDMVNETRKIEVSYQEFVEAALVGSSRFIVICLKKQPEREQEPDFIALVRDRDIVSQWHHVMWDNT